MKYINFIDNRAKDTSEVALVNENYFVKVFYSLMHTRNPKILLRMLKVINFYIHQDTSQFQKQIIDPQTILWMLEILEHQREEKYLCCCTSSTLLSIVSKHEIHFFYQEVAIIKKFNLALQNTNVFDAKDQDSRSSNSLEDSNTIIESPEDFEQAPNYEFDNINKMSDVVEGRSPVNQKANV